MISSDGTVILTQEEYDEMYEESCHAYLTVLKKDKEISEMKKQLCIATKALKKLTRDCNKWGIAREALKEMEVNK